MGLYLRQITIKATEVYKITKDAFGKYEYSIGAHIFPGQNLIIHWPRVSLGHLKKMFTNVWISRVVQGISLTVVYQRSVEHVTSVSCEEWRSVHATNYIRRSSAFHNLNVASMFDLVPLYVPPSIANKLCTNIKHKLLPASY
jgi:hypothetical protein